MRENRASMVEFTDRFTECFTFYNGERSHRSLSNQTPEQVYRLGRGGGVRILEQFNQKGSETEIKEESWQRCAAACNVECRA